MSSGLAFNGTIRNLNSSLTTLYSNSTNETVTLQGSHFKDPVFVAPIVINAICALAFIILTCASWFKRADVQGSRAAFAAMMTLLLGMTSSVSFPFLMPDVLVHSLWYYSRSFLRTLVEEVLHEYELRVPKVYLILPSLKPVLDNITMVALIAMIYHIAKNRNQWVCRDLTGYKWWQRFHHYGVTLLLLFGLADMALYIYAQLLLWANIKTNEQEYQRLAKAANTYGQVHLTYTTLYLVVAVEILVWAIYVAQRARRQHLRSGVSHP